MFSEKTIDKVIFKFERTEVNLYFVYLFAILGGLDCQKT